MYFTRKCSTIQKLQNFLNFKIDEKTDESSDDLTYKKSEILGWEKHKKGFLDQHIKWEFFKNKDELSNLQLGHLHSYNNLKYLRMILVL